MRLIPSDPDIETVLGRINDGSLDLQPDFQRGAVWSRPKQRLLVDSVLRSWYVPPIHVVLAKDDQQIVLDGQQRLRAIWEFSKGHFTVDGSAEPVDPEIESLDGLRYEDLPAPAKRRFNRFTLRLFEVVDYEAEEPYELFFRLNQPTTLTAAEKRNAFFGVPRQQVKQLASYAAQEGLSQERVGFSNARMAYEDIVARFLWTLEVGSLDEKVTASRITERYRKEAPFAEDVVKWGERSISVLFSSSSLDLELVRLNKATMHTWLCFVARALALECDISQLSDFIRVFESTRSRLRRESEIPNNLYQLPPALLDIFNDRATSRVNDVSSVLLRDVILWLCLAILDPKKEDLPGRLDVIQDALKTRERSTPLESTLLAACSEASWGSIA